MPTNEKLGVEGIAQDVNGVGDEVDRTDVVVVGVALVEGIAVVGVSVVVEDWVDGIVVTFGVAVVVDAFDVAI